MQVGEQPLSSPSRHPPWIWSAGKGIAEADQSPRRQLSTFALDKRPCSTQWMQPNVHILLRTACTRDIATILITLS